MRFENAPVGIMHFNKDGIVTGCNDNILRIIGFSRDELIGFNLLGLSDKRIVSAVNEALKGRNEIFEGNLRFSKTADKALYLWVQFSPFKLDDLSAGGVGVVEDITERKKVEEKILRKNFHDSLTSVYNRSYLIEEMRRLDTPRQLPLAVIMADLNGLRLVNGVFGYKAGDEMLKALAGILQESCRADDIIARLDDDKFVIFLTQAGTEEVQLLINRIMEKSEGAKVEGIPVSLTTGFAEKNNQDQDIITTLHEAEANLYNNKLTERIDGKSALVKALLKALLEKGFETAEHTEAMKTVAQKIGEKLKLSDTELKKLDLGIELHDLGKINMPQAVLSGKDPLTDEEWELCKKHPEIGFRIAEATEEFAHVAKDILAHHEHWDGSGYPQGLKGTAIPLLARITAVADAYQVMSSGRPYRGVRSKEDIRAEFKKCSGTQFDPEVVELLLSVI